MNKKRTGNNRKNLSVLSLKQHFEPKQFTIANRITLYRLFAFPVILYFVLTGKETLFVVFFVINLLTDVADGFIARRLKMETETGARLDSMADNLTYILAFTGIFVFKWEDFRPHLASFLVFIAFLVSTVLLSLVKFKRFPSFHLYSTKIGGYIEGIFFITLFTVGFITPFYYFMIFWGILAAIEHIAIQLVIPRMRSNVKGLYWVLREKNSTVKQKK
jgi:CDP-diacylglycerol--glycerol-3-phosphate 3-phosphatidyltransferase